MPALDRRPGLVYHHGEAVRHRGHVALVVEHLHRVVSFGGAVSMYVRGRVVRDGHPALCLPGWHLAVRRDGRGLDLHEALLARVGRN